jgi:hypothetical protein|nr:hypothetical protein [Candidatus Krumholzibacteria bacterium]
MSDTRLPAPFAEIFRQVHEPGDKVAVITPEGRDPGLELAQDVHFSLQTWLDGKVPTDCDLVMFLELMPRLSAAEAGRLATSLARLVRPGGMLFLTAWSTDHSGWNQPGSAWIKSGTRELEQPSSGAHRFFLHDDEVVTLFAAWNVLHHEESPDGFIDIVLMRPESRTVDVSTALYEG